MADRKPYSRQNPSVARRGNLVAGFFLLLGSSLVACTGILTLVDSAQKLPVTETGLHPALVNLLLVSLATLALYFWPVLLYVVGWMAEYGRERAARILLGLAGLIGLLLMCSGFGAAIVFPFLALLTGDSGMRWGGDLGSAFLWLNMSGLWLGLVIRDHPVLRSIRLFPSRGAKADNQHNL